MTGTWGEIAGAAQSYRLEALLSSCNCPSHLGSLAPDQQLTFALVIDGTARGHGEKAEGIESSPEEETRVGRLLWVGGLLRRPYSGAWRGWRKEFGNSEQGTVPNFQEHCILGVSHHLTFLHQQPSPVSGSHAQA